MRMPDREARPFEALRSHLYRCTAGRPLVYSSRTTPLPLNPGVSIEGGREALERSRPLRPGPRAPVGGGHIKWLSRSRSCRLEHFDSSMQYAWSLSGVSFETVLPSSTGQVVPACIAPAGFVSSVTMIRRSLNRMTSSMEGYRRLNIYCTTSGIVILLVPDSIRQK